MRPKITVSKSNKTTKIEKLENKRKIANTQEEKMDLIIQQNNLIIELLMDRKTPQ